jgi:hypothetical protein
MQFGIRIGRMPSVVLAETIQIAKALAVSLAFPFPPRGRGKCRAGGNVPEKVQQPVCKPGGTRVF